MNRQAMSDALEALPNKHREANITAIETRVDETENALHIQISSMNPFGTLVGAYAQEWSVNLDETEEEGSKWEEGDEEKVLDMLVEQLHAGAKSAQAELQAPPRDVEYDD